jgi:hypothetical protein
MSTIEPPHEARGLSNGTLQGANHAPLGALVVAHNDARRGGAPSICGERRPGRRCRLGRRNREALGFVPLWQARLARVLA